MKRMPEGPVATIDGLGEVEGLVIPSFGGIRRVGWMHRKSGGFYRSAVREGEANAEALDRALAEFWEIAGEANCG